MEALTWMVVPACYPDAEEEEDADDLGLKTIRDVKKAGYDILLAHLFFTLGLRIGRQSWEC